ncbi:MAG TPA: hypothetical protein VF691_08615 [Cytophagaceae bacterium]|jgi:hypothetical protein
MSKKKRKNEDQYSGGQDITQELKRVFKQQSTKNVLIGIGIAGALGALIYAAVKYVPFDDIISELEDKINFRKEGENAQTEEQAASAHA